MDIEGQGVTIRIEAAAQSDKWLLDAAAEIRAAAKARGLVIPAGETALQDTVEVVDTAREPAPVIPETAETLSAQLASAIKGYQAVTGVINEGKGKKIEVATEEQVQTEFDAWLTPERLEAVNAIKETQPEVTFALIVTPNTPVSAGDIVNVAERFGRNQPYSTAIRSKIYECYTAEQLSGVDEGDNSVNFTLIPSELTPELAGKTAKEQRTTLAELQKAHPSLEVPSVLADVTYWETLRQSGAVSGNDTFDETYIRHFDLPEVRVDDWLCVPDSYVGEDGEAYLDRSDADYRDVGRVAVGRGTKQ